MDKYELNIKLEQMRKLIRRKEYNTASKIADTIEWNRIKNNQDLMLAADAYEASGKLVNAREVLLYAYERTNLGRQIVYRLCRVATKLGDVEEAEEFYSEFVRMAAGDNSKYILQYEIARARGNNLDTQIAILSKYLDEEMDDRWAYELAKLYHKAGKGQDCTKMCDTIILWFSDGKYVDRALELKSLYAPLTKEQQSRVFKESIIPVIDRTDEVEDAKMILDEMQGINPEEIKVDDYSKKVSYDTVNIQKALAESMRDVFEDENENQEASFVENADGEGLEGKITSDRVDMSEVDALMEELEKTKEVNFGATKVFVPISKQMLGEQESETEEYITSESETEEAEDTDTKEAEAENAVTEDAKTKEVEAEDTVTEESIVTEEYDENHIEGQVTIEEMIEMYNLMGEGDEPIEGDKQPEKAETADESELSEVEEDMEVEQGGVPENIEVEESVETTEIEEEEPVEEAMVEEDEESAEESMIEEDEESAEEAMIEENEESAEEVTIEEQEAFVVEDKETELADEISNMLEEDRLEEPSEENDLEIESETELEDFEEDGDEVGVNDKESEELDELRELEKIDESEEDDEEIKAVEESNEPAFIKRSLSPDAKQELKDFISRFTGVKGIDKQILKAMHSVLKTSAIESNFIFIIGDVKSGKTTLAIDIIKVLNKIMENRGRKIAKVPGSSLSGKNMDKFMEKVVESDIVVEKVSSMGEDSLEELVKAVKTSGESKIVIFEDEVITSEKFVRGICEKLNVGDNIIVLKQSRIREWAEIAKEYIREEGYEIDEMGILAMHERIDKLHALTIVIQKNHVEQLIDRAIARHNKRKLSNFFRGNKSKVLTEKDFIED